MATSQVNNRSSTGSQYFLDNFFLALTINGTTQTETSFTDFSFSIQDSIYSLYPKGLMTVNDYSGLLQEYLFLAPNTPIGIQYGIRGPTSKGVIKLSCPFKVRDNETISPVRHSTFAGQVNLKLVHDYFDTQYLSSRAYETSISEIVKELVNKYNNSNVRDVEGKSDYGFRKKIIEDTLPVDTWYQPLETDAKFITGNLQKMAFSQTYPNSPFFCFINLNNEFYFVPADRLQNQKPKIKLKPKALLDSNEAVLPDIEVTPVEERTVAQYKIEASYVSIKRLTDDYQDFRANVNVGFFYFEDLLGTSMYETSSKFIDTSFNQSDLVTNIITSPVLEKSEDNQKLYTSFEMEDHRDIRNKSEIYKAKKNYAQKNSLFPEKYILLCPLNPLLVSGEFVYIQVNKQDLQSSSVDSQISENFSGNFLILHSEHIWDGKEKRGYTKIIVGRKFHSLASEDYKITPQLVKPRIIVQEES